MSVRKGALSDQPIVDWVVALYISPRKPTLADVGEVVGESYQTVMAIVRAHLQEDRYRAEKALRYSRSKMGEKNPMTGRIEYKHPRWKGPCSDQKGHLTQVYNGQRRFVHHFVMSEEMGIALDQFPPEGFEVHHIDGNGENNDLSNLALVTTAAHRNLHASWPKSWRRPLWAQWVSGI